MNIIDRVYGEIEITDPVIIDLINSPTLERLKGVDQAGYFELSFPGTRHSRFEHSVGVYALLTRYGASLEERIAGLIHDVSHTAFSHCADYVLADSGAKQDHQDNTFKTFVRASTIPEILAAHGFDLERILDDRNFPLKETLLPDLCADRIDYSLRWAVIAYGKDAQADSFLEHLTAEKNTWIFRDFESAQAYAELFRQLNATYFSGIQSATMFRTVGDYLKHALAKRYITEQDLYTTDSEVLEKIAAHLDTDAELRLYHRRMNGETGIVSNPSDYDARVSCKSRVVDPLCRHEGAIRRVSDINPAWKTVLAEESEPKVYFLKFES